VLTFRLTLGLTIHAAESTLYSGLARLVIAQVPNTDGFSDALFEANDAESWRDLMLRSERDTGAAAVSSSDTPDVFLPTVLLAQTMVNLHRMRELENVPLATGMSSVRLPEFYDFMLSFAKDHGVLPILERSRCAETPAHLRSLAALWHYTCVIRLAPMDLIAEAAGRGGNPDSESVAEIRAWVATPTARLAALHCGHVLYQAADLQDLGFLVPR